jgi:hypothetical protein
MKKVQIKIQNKNKKPRKIIKTLSKRKGHNAHAHMGFSYYYYYYLLLPKTKISISFKQIWMLLEIQLLENTFYIYVCKSSRFNQFGTNISLYEIYKVTFVTFSTLSTFNKFLTLFVNLSKFKKEIQKLSNKAIV